MPKEKVFEVLLAEDSTDDVFLTKEALKENGIRCNLNVVRDGVETIEYLRAKRPHEKRLVPDIVLLDLNMPRKNGKEVLDEMKRDDELKTIPAAILTTSSVAADVIECYKKHANCYMSKPVDINEFTQAVRQVKSFWFRTAELPGGR